MYAVQFSESELYNIELVIQVAQSVFLSFHYNLYIYIICLVDSESAEFTLNTKTVDFSLIYIIVSFICRQ